MQDRARLIRNGNQAMFDSYFKKEEKQNSYQLLKINLVMLFFPISRVLIWKARSRSTYKERDESNQAMFDSCFKREGKQNCYQFITINLEMIAFQFQEYWFGMQDRARLIRNGTKVTRINV